MKTHYHVLNGLHGCMPDNNDLCMTKSEARSVLKETVKYLRDGGTRFNGNLKKCYFEATDNRYYADIEECQEAECLKEIDEE